MVSGEIKAFSGGFSKSFGLIYHYSKQSDISG